jgi:hypothetical protein
MTEIGRGSIERRAVAAKDNNFGAIGSEFARRRETDAAVAAGDHSHFLVQFHSGLSKPRNVASLAVALRMRSGTPLFTHLLPVLFASPTRLLHDFVSPRLRLDQLGLIHIASHVTLWSFTIRVECAD